MVKKDGFTIIELLVVIVIIGILVAITAVAYNGVTSSANRAALQSDAKSVATQLTIYGAGKGAFPDDLSQINVKNKAGGGKFQYSVSNASEPKGWCLSISKSTDSFYVSSTDQTPSVGVCLGHYAADPDVNPVQDGLMGAWSSPIRFNSTTVPRFKVAIFGGKYLDLPTQNGGGWQQRLTSRWDSYAGTPKDYYCYRSPSGDTPCAFPVSKRGSDGLFSWALNDNTSLLDGNTGFGSHQSSIQYNWLGPMRVVAYDRVLSQAEIDQVLAWLRVQVMNE